MKIEENVPLAPFTTLGVGGSARFFAEIQDEKDIDEALAFSRARNLPLFVLGGGSNVLVPDSGVDGLVLKLQRQEIAVQESDADVTVRAEAGALWDKVVDSVSQYGVFGIANLAGIPGTAGGAAVQNIGAYGAELSTVFDYAEVIETATGNRMRVARSDAEFLYRSSIFKKRADLLIIRVALRLMKGVPPNVTYPDLVQARSEGVPISTPAEIVRAVRNIRARKFPQNSQGRTAGSFFKNPVVPRELAASLSARFPGLPVFPQQNSGMVKLPLAWLLDHALQLKGYALDSVRLYEKQPLVIVANDGATAVRVDELARYVAERVFEATGIRIEREVETFGARR